MLLGVDDGLVSGNLNFADILFILAFVAAVLSAVGRFGDNPLAKHSAWLISLAVALLSLAWLVL